MISDQFWGLPHKEMHIELDGKSVIMICLSDLFGGVRRPSEFEASIENWVVTRKLCNHFSKKIKNLEGCYVFMEFYFYTEVKY